MESDKAFITHLMDFGLTEKEAQCYFYLLKYGPKTPSPLAKSLKTYREDIFRTLQSLIDKGMVRPSLDSPTLYTAVELETALESVLKLQENELRKMEQRKRELEELASEQRFRPTDDVSTFKIIKNLKEFAATVIPILASLENEWLNIVPARAAVVWSQFGMLPYMQEFIERGGKQYTVIDVTYPIIETVNKLIDMGADVRHFGNTGLAYNVFDSKISISAINAELTRFSPNEPIALLWTDDRAYARYLTSTFETLWQQSVPAGGRIHELLEQGPPQG
ncbi:MAG: TrmB family transcriptional regulator [Halobacteriota archaeon]